MGFAAGPRKRAISDINVTPLVDVMLVLLVIFMVTAPMLNQSLDVNLPDVAASASPQQDKTITLSIRKDGRVFVDNVALPSGDGDKALAAIIKTRKSEPIYLEADEGVPYGRVAKVIGIVQTAGATKLHLATEEPKSP